MYLLVNMNTPLLRDLILSKKKTNSNLSHAKIAKELGCSKSWVTKVIVAEEKNKEKQKFENQKKALIKEIEEERKEFFEELEGMSNDNNNGWIEKNLMSSYSTKVKSVKRYYIAAAIIVIVIIILWAG